MKFVIRTRNEFLNVADRLAPELDGKPYQVTVKPFQRDRSLDQNSKFHAMLRELAAHCGYTESEMKDWAKAELGLTKLIQIGERTIEVPLPSSEYTVDQFGDLIERIYQVGAEVGCVFQN